MKMSTLTQPIQAACTEEKSVSDGRVSLIRNELATLTGKHAHAVILNQLLYWTQRTKDFHLMLEEEKKKSGAKSDSPQYGWIYKTASDLVAETMLSIDRTTIRRYVQCLIAKGWIQTRVNPQSRWDRTTQYRVNVKKIQEDLIALGHKLSELAFCGVEEALSRESQNLNEQNPHSNGELHAKTAEAPNGQNACSNDYIAPSNGQLPPETAENCNGQNAHSNGQIAHSNGYIAPSNEQFPSETAENCNGQNALSNGQFAHSNGQNARSNTEITTENTIEITKKEHRAGHAGTGAYAYEEELDGSDREVPPTSAKVAALMVDLWRRYVNPEVISLTDERKRRLESLLSLHFQSDLRLWESFCLRVKAAPFLMGEGKRKWQITLDWILAKGNLLRVLEGNFDDSERIEHQKNEQSKGVQDRETLSLLASIQDPIWKNWCSQLMGIHPLTGSALMDGEQPIKAVLTVSELKGITQARFMEFDDRLVWIECFDQKTLNKIEDLRLKFSSVAQATFPKARAVRGHLNLSFNQPQFPQQKGEKHAE
ncbi:MAG: hypothetical protein KBD36_03385 [Alphaproteobacteria bacterium]|nr:hypothetical protein [Alphaproteobacteria bacterium]